MTNGEYPQAFAEDHADYFSAFSEQFASTLFEMLNDRNGVALNKEQQQALISKTFAAHQDALRHELPLMVGDSDIPSSTALGRDRGDIYVSDGLFERGISWFPNGEWKMGGTVDVTDMSPDDAARFD